LLPYERSGWVRAGSSPRPSTRSLRGSSSLCGGISRASPNGRGLRLSSLPGNPSRGRQSAL
jgi:hypothetical protein